MIGSYFNNWRFFGQSTTFLMLTVITASFVVIYVVVIDFCLGLTFRLGARIINLVKC
jgi:hypothetical protein